jgi:tRNA 2-selenouridine synthase SelU
LRMLYHLRNQFRGIICIHCNFDVMQTAIYTVIVNNSKNVVTEISMDYFKAKSLDTKREAYFSKNTGYALLNFNFRERV